MKSPQQRFLSRRPANKQRGVVLLFSLIALVILLIAAVGLVRGFNTSLFTAGNIAFKRDMQNQGERAMDKVLTSFRTGTLATSAARASNSTLLHYSAAMLPTNAQGIPTALQSSTAYGAVADTSTDITPATDTTLTGQGISSIQYVVDRLCKWTGDENSLGANACVLASNATPAGTSSSNLQSADRAPLCPTCSSAAPQGVVYRLTVKVNGPRGTTSFFQSTFTIPSST